MGHVIWITGQSGAGKSTLARGFASLRDAVVLDGDEMRESISLGEGFEPEDRERHCLRVARLAKVLSRQRSVVVSVIAPTVKLRSLVDEVGQVKWVFLPRKSWINYREMPYEIPDTSWLVLDGSVGDNVKELVESYDALC